MAAAPPLVWGKGYMTKRQRILMIDGLILGGLILLTAGLWSISIPIALIVLGASLLILGIMAALL